MSKKYFIETFGCQMNDLDSEKIAGNLCQGGMEPASDPTSADVIILNTCSVREKAVQKVYARLGELKRQKARKQGALVGVVGCMAQLEGARVLSRAPFVDFLAGPQKGNVIDALIERAERTRTTVIDLRMDEDPEPLETPNILRESPWRAGVTIQEGCNRLCTFCVVPFTRGRERDRDIESIVSEVASLVQRGCVEITLLGQTVNSYRDPNRRDLRFADLLRRLTRLDDLKRIRYTSPHPSDFTDELLDVMVDHPQVCNHVHLPAQSGSTSVLRRMRRGYSREAYIKKIQKIKAAKRPIAISSDIIVGFPGESERDFMDTISLLDQVQYDSVFSFKYSPRPNTPAMDLDGEISEEEKGRRLSFLQERQKLIQYNRNAGFLGQVEEVLVEGKARSRFSLAGRTSSNRVVNFDGPDDLVGRFVSVQITGFSANSLKGIMIPSAAEEP